MPDSNFSKIRTEVIQDIIRLTREKYVYPEIGEKISSWIQKKFEDGQYDKITQESDLAFSLTMDLQSISRDLHWNVAYDPKGAADQVDPEKEMDEDRRRAI